MSTMSALRWSFAGFSASKHLTPQSGVCTHCALPWPCKLPRQPAEAAATKCIPFLARHMHGHSTRCVHAMSAWEDTHLLLEGNVVQVDCSVRLTCDIHDVRRKLPQVYRQVAEGPRSCHNACSLPVQHTHEACACRQQLLAGRFSSKNACAPAA